MTELENTGERMIPALHKGLNKYGAHLIRYQAALPFVKDRTVLDIACGTGYGSQLMAKTAKNVYGVDLSAESVAYATENYGAKNIEFLTGDAVKIPLPDQTVDVVVSYETIEHVPNYQAFLDEIKRVMKPGGTLIISSPNSAVSIGGNEYHHKEFNLSEFESVLKDNFKHHDMYHQSLWLYNSLLNAKLQSGEWQQSLPTTKTAAAKPEETEFYLAVASDTKITTIIESAGVITEYHRQQPSMKREIAKLKDSLAAAQKEVDRLKKQGDSAEAEKLRRRLSDIENSKAWRLARKLQKVSAVGRSKPKA
jgi:ubiquinone/menaquinone biosynthesis C-methylase UbiE